MSLFSAPPVSELLERQRGLLDKAFGAGAYSIECIGPEQATVRSGSLEWRVSYDARDRSIGSLIVESGTLAGEAIPDTWARSLGEQPTGWPKDGSGRVSLSLDDQMTVEIERMARLNNNVFCDPQRARDAANFVNGYHAAYNDWASGDWG